MKNCVALALSTLLLLTTAGTTIYIFYLVSMVGMYLLEMSDLI